MLRRINIIIAAIVVAVVSLHSENIISRADSAYTADDYTTALSLYQQAATEYGTSATLWYNIGNTEYRLGNLGKAILAYERSLRLDPSNHDTRANLAFVKSKCIDRPADKGSFISNTTDGIATMVSPDTWAWIAFTAFALMLASVAIYLFTSTVLLRKTGFFSAIFLTVFTAFAVIMTLRAAGIATSKTEGVIISKSAILSTSPRQPKHRTEEAMLLHEGTRISIIDSVSAVNDTTGVKWYDVRIDNSHRAWIKSTDIEII